MLVKSFANQVGVISSSPHSLGLSTELTTPSWGDGNWFVNNEKKWNAAGMKGLGELGYVTGDSGTYGLGFLKGLGSLGCACHDGPNQGNLSINKGGDSCKCHSGMGDIKESIPVIASIGAIIWYGYNLFFKGKR